MPTFRDDLHLGHSVPMVDTEDIVDGAITEPKLADDSVSTRTIQDGAVTEPKIAEKAITEPKLADAAVSTRTIKFRAVTESKIGDSAVSTRTIQNGAVTNPKIANGAVSMNKLDNETQTLIQRGADSSWTPMGDYDVDALYYANDLVFDPETNSSYLSLRADNMGHAVTDEEWWMKVLDGSYVNLLEEELQQLVDSISEGTQQQVEELNEALEALEAQADQSRQDIQDIVDSLAVVQTTGQSTSDVMSQKAVTDSLFDKDIINVSVPTLTTSSPGSATSGGVYGNVLNNADAFDLSSIKLYCSTAKSSFVLAIGHANTTAKTYSISHSYTINKPLSVGENVIDVSEYNIVIPANALVACTGTTSWKRSIMGITMVGAISTTEGTSGTYSSNFDNAGMVFVLIGTHTNYIPKIDTFKSGEKVSEVSIINNLNGGESDVLSAEQGKNLNSQFIELVSSFNTEIVTIETPQISTGTPASALYGSYWGTILTNKTKIILQQVKFYSNAAKTSFVIAVGTADTNSKTYHINNNYTITASVSAGENTIDVSSYSIQLPPKSLVVCTGATTWKSINSGEHLVGAMSSINAEASGSFSNVNSGAAQCVFIGTTKKYNVIIPDDAIKAFGQSNVLFRKKYVALGDSFTDFSYAYPYIIGNRNNMTVINQGLNSSALNGYIVNERYNNIPQDVDYITIWYGINDANHGISVGTINDEPTTITSETSTTTCGGFNWFFKWLLTNRPLAHIGVIVTDFCGQIRREAIIACCQKWGIAYLDLYDPTIPMIRTRGNTHYSHDTSIAPLGYVEVCSEAKALRTAVFSTDPATSNIHPNDDCHLWQSNLIENFMRGL